MEPNEILEKEIEEEVYIKGNNIYSAEHITKIGRSTVRINFSKTYGTGVFIKFMKNNLPFYTLLTNEHVITPEKVKKKEKINITYDNIQLSIFLDEEERIIRHFKDIFEIDLILIEIIEKDNINDEYFLSPKNVEESGYNNLIGKKIVILQFPKGGPLKYSHGKIKRIDGNTFTHTASTDKGSHFFNRR